MSRLVREGGAFPQTPSIVLVTGGTGTLGGHVVASLAERGVPDRIVSRRDRRRGEAAGHDWIVADLEVDSLDPVLDGIDAVIHLASGGGGEADITATRRLLHAAEAVSVRHVVVISIIGCDRIPLPYYASKVAIEQVTRASAVPWSIVRVAQFHSFVDRLVALPAAAPLPAPIIADLQFQPVDEREAADRLVGIALGDPLGYAPEVAGPEVLTLGEIAGTWLRESGREGSLIPIPLSALPADGASGSTILPWVRPALEGYRVGANTPHGDRTLGRVRFVDWLRMKRALSTP